MEVVESDSRLNIMREDALNSSSWRRLMYGRGQANLDRHSRKTWFACCCHMLVPLNYDDDDDLSHIYCLLLYILSLSPAALQS